MVGICAAHRILYFPLHDNFSHTTRSFRGVYRMSWCDKLHLEDATVQDLIQELDAAGNEVREGHIIILEEITREWRDKHG